MKKWMAFALSVVLCLALCACGSELELPESLLPSGTEAPQQTTLPGETEPELVDGLRPEFKETMDSYEAFYDEFCEVTKQYKENPADVELLLRYGELLERAKVVDEAFKCWDEDEMTVTEAKYYLEVQVRVLKKLAELTE